MDQPEKQPNKNHGNNTDTELNGMQVCLII